MIIVHVGTKVREPATEDGDVHIWAAGSRSDWSLAHDQAERGSPGRLAVLVVQRHVFVFEKLGAEERKRLRKFGKLVELDRDAYYAFFDLLACLRQWRFFFRRTDAAGLLSRVAKDVDAWELLQRFASALQEWARTWPPGEASVAGFTAVRRLRDYVRLPLAWHKAMNSTMPTDWTLPIAWVEALAPNR